jgi:hypothetical protein
MIILHFEWPSNIIVGLWANRGKAPQAIISGLFNLSGLVADFRPTLSFHDNESPYGTIHDALAKSELMERDLSDQGFPAAAPNSSTGNKSGLKTFANPVEITFLNHPGQLWHHPDGFAYAGFFLFTSPGLNHPSRCLPSGAWKCCIGNLWVNNFRQYL